MATFSMGAASGFGFEWAGSEEMRLIVGGRRYLGFVFCVEAIVRRLFCGGGLSVSA